MKIELLETMESSVLDGHRSIPVGTIMEKTNEYLSWTYFSGSGFTLVVMGWGEVSKLIPPIK